MQSYQHKPGKWADTDILIALVELEQDKSTVFQKSIDILDDLLGNLSHR